MQRKEAIGCCLAAGGASEFVAPNQSLDGFSDREVCRRKGSGEAFEAAIAEFCELFDHRGIRIEAWETPDDRLWIRGRDNGVNELKNVGNVRETSEEDFKLRREINCRSLLPHWVREREKLFIIVNAAGINERTRFAEAPRSLRLRNVVAHVRRPFII
jgi:hypothetical protein